MKRCPVCQTMLFEDMAVCYGCMHRFPDGSDDPSGEGAIDANREATPVKAPLPLLMLPTIDLGEETQVDGEGGSSCADEQVANDWVLRLEMKSPGEEVRVWKFELCRTPTLAAA